MYERIEACPVCSHHDLRNTLICKDHLVTGESFAITTCTNCGLLVTNPRPDPNSITKYYQSDKYLSHNTDVSLLGKFYSLAQRYTLWYKYRLLRKHRASGRLLDYGCGSGTFLQYIARKGYEARGVEPTAAALESTLSKKVAAYATLEQAREQEAKFDIITMWHVLEHVHDLRPTLKHLRKSLHKKGLIVIAVPNIMSWDSQHYKQNWAAYDVPRHLYHFRDQNLALLLKDLKFKHVHTAPLYLDAFYISLLSEKYASGHQNIIKSILNGCKSNIYGLTNNQYSSMIYVFQKQ